MISKLKELFSQLELMHTLSDVSDGLINSNDSWVKFDHLALLPIIREKTHWVVNSVDTLFLSDNIDFIEFKNQPISNIDRSRLARKGVSSLKILKILMLNYELEFSTALANNYVLVYSNNKSKSRRFAVESISRRRGFYFLLKKLVLQRQLYKQVLIINENIFIQKYKINILDNSHLPMIV